MEGLLEVNHIKFVGLFFCEAQLLSLPVEGCFQGVFDAQGAALDKEVVFEVGGDVGEFLNEFGQISAVEVRVGIFVDGNTAQVAAFIGEFAIVPAERLAGELRGAIQVTLACAGISHVGTTAAVPVDDNVFPIPDGILSHYIVDFIWVYHTSNPTRLDCCLDLFHRDLATKKI